LSNKQPESKIIVSHQGVDNIGEFTEFAGPDILKVGPSELFSFSGVLSLNNVGHNIYASHCNLSFLRKCSIKRDSVIVDVGHIYVCTVTKLSLDFEYDRFFTRFIATNLFPNHSSENDSAVPQAIAMVLTEFGGYVGKERCR